MCVRVRVCSQARYSVLQPGGYIRPHCGGFNNRLRLHLALQAPADDAINVQAPADETQVSSCFLSLSLSVSLSLSLYLRPSLFLCVCVCICVRACVRACMRVCARECTTLCFCGSLSSACVRSKQALRRGHQTRRPLAQRPA